MLHFSFGPFEGVGDPDWSVQLNGAACEANKQYSISLSPVIKSFLAETPQAPLLVLDIQFDPSHAELVTLLLMGREIVFTMENITFLIFLARTLKIELLERDLLNFMKFKNNPSIDSLKQLERGVSEFSSETFEEAFETFSKYSENKYFISHVIFNGCVARNDKCELFVKMVQKLEVTKEFEGVCKAHFNKKENVQESLFLMRLLAESGSLEKETIERSSILYGDFFYEHKEKYQNENIENVNDNENKENSRRGNKYSSYANSFQMSAFNLHEEYSRGGVNPDRVAVSVRMDDTTAFSDNETTIYKNYFVSPSIYERSTMVNAEKIPLLSYAAYFGANECFNELITKCNCEANKDLSKYAVCGGCQAIVDYCEKNELFSNDFNNVCLEKAVIFHRFDIFKFLVEKLKVPITEKVCDLVIKHFEFNCLIYIVSNGADLNRLFAKSAKYGNEEAAILLADFCSDFSGSVSEEESEYEGEIGKTVLHYASENGLTKLVKVLFEKEEMLRNGGSPSLIDINGSMIEDTSFSLTGGTSFNDAQQQPPKIDVNAKTEEQVTPFQLACREGRKDIVTLFLGRDDVDIDAVSDFDKSAFQFASKNGHTDIALEITKAKARQKVQFPPS